MQMTGGMLLHNKTAPTALGAPTRRLRCGFAGAGEVALAGVALERLGVALVPKTEGCKLRRKFLFQLEHRREEVADPGESLQSLLWLEVKMLDRLLLQLVPCYGHGDE